PSKGQSEFARALAASHLRMGEVGWSNPLKVDSIPANGTILAPASPHEYFLTVPSLRREPPGLACGKREDRLREPRRTHLPTDHSPPSARHRGSRPPRCPAP